MANSDQFSLTLRVMIGTAAFGLSIYFIHTAAEFIIPILLAGIIVLSASPLLKWLLSKKVPRWVTHFKSKEVRNFSEEREA